MRVLLTWILIAIVLAGCTTSSPSTPSPAAGEPLGTDSSSTSFPTRYFLNATLLPPVTRYNVISYSANPVFGPGVGERVLPNESYTYAWSISDKCGRFEKLNNTAIWHHGDDTNCDHSSTSHPGKVTVVIGGFDNATASTGYGTCEYDGGSNTGRSPECFVSSVAPEGQEPARRTSIPIPALAAPVAVAVAAIVLELARRR